LLLFFYSLFILLLSVPALWITQTSKQPTSKYKSALTRTTIFNRHNTKSNTDNKQAMIAHAPKLENQSQTIDLPVIRVFKQITKNRNRQISKASH